MSSQEATERLDRCGPTRLGGTQTTFPTTTSRSRSGAWRVATWLAVLPVFLFRTPLSGDGSACPVMCRRPGAFEVAFGSMCKSGVVWISNITRVRSETAPLPNHRVGTVASPVDDQARCECRRVLDVRGRHRAACLRSGRLRSRAVPMEQKLAPQ